MQQNLKTGKFRNGDPIPGNPDNISWQNSTSAAFSIYNGEATNDSLYGKLYNWYAINDERGLAPKGWHIPDNDEWDKLVNFLGGKEFAGAKMRSTSGWLNTDDGNNGNGNNSSGFNSYPLGCRNEIEPCFNNDFKNTCYWSSSKSEDNEFANYLMLCNYGDFNILTGLKSNGMYVRCIKD